MSDNHNMLHPKNIIFFKNLSLKHTPNNEEFMLMVFVPLFNCSYMKKKIVVYNMIQDFFYLCILIHCTLYLCILPQTTFVSLDAFWIYCTAIYVTVLFLNTIFHNKLLLLKVMSELFSRHV
jgi:hypothetical protein